MTKEELGNATGKDLIEQRDYCGIDSYYSDYLDDVNAEMLKRFNRLTELEKENAELKERHAEILEAFASTSSGDDFEMAESAREIMEILDTPCYRHGKVVSKLTKAREIILKLYNAGRDVLMCRAEEKAYDNLSDAINDKSIEKFLQEVSK